MRMIVKLKPAAAEALLGNAPAEEADRELTRVLEKLGIQLSVMHPGTADTQLRTYFAVNVPDDQSREIQQELLRTPGVDAAYFKPADAAP